MASHFHKMLDGLISDIIISDILGFVKMFQREKCYKMQKRELHYRYEAAGMGKGNREVMRTVRVGVHGVLRVFPGCFVVQAGNTHCHPENSF